MKSPCIFRILLIVTIVFIFSLVGLIYGYFFIGQDSQIGNSSSYYVSKEAKLDGEDLSGKALEKALGVKKISETMSIYLKDTGDCGIRVFFQEQLPNSKNGLLGSWKNTEDGVAITIAGTKDKEEGDENKQSAVKNQIILEDSWNTLKYNATYHGKKLEIVLEKAEKMPEYFKEHPELTFGFDYNNKETQALSNFMLDGQYCEYKGKLYGKYFNEDLCTLSVGNLKQGSADSSEQETASLNIDGIKQLVEGGQAKFLTVYKEHLFFLWVPTDDTKEEICSMPIDGTKIKILAKGDFDYLQLRYGKIYFTNNKYRLCSMSTEGKGKKIILDKEVYMPYVIEQNWLIYQDDADGEKLHIATIDGKYDRAITNERTYAWTIKGRNLFYTSTSLSEDDAKHKCKLHKLKLDSLKTLTSDQMPKIETDKQDSALEVAENEMGDSFAICNKTLYGGDGKFTTLNKWNSFGNKLFEDTPQTDYLLYVSKKIRVSGLTDENLNFKDIFVIDNSNDEKTSFMN